ncbi:hypothetical protein [Xanthomonas citri]|uniref:hypothetical protein n=1 Tax=Xanthomonas citri TaxID=346 RepID=UPI003558809F
MELINQMRQPRWTVPREILTAIEARPASTAAQMDHSELLLHHYTAAGVDRNVQENNLQAVDLVTQPTKQAQGFIGPTMQQLNPNEQGSIRLRQSRRPLPGRT